ncbi:hypothetical protein LX69_01062 [Breznakibacter xylanolyticus]|uniref:Uncharacterized protein n=1 Tax=Breznakibacter xylanolyticus TaxID=990 RepID=A0A2W7QA94_9BACT|nr:hypothetical protein LX69_01062 [Breznakibacter xylanolyticus]
MIVWFMQFGFLCFEAFFNGSQETLKCAFSNGQNEKGKSRYCFF